MDEELIRISEEIFRDVIARLTLNLRFMDIALNRYRFVPDTTDFRCDGTLFHYSPFAVIRIYQNDPAKLTRGYFHVVLHSLFRHVFFAENRMPSIWDLAADIAVENVILGLNLPCMEMEDDDEKRRVIAKLKEKAPVFTAQKLYHVLSGMERDEIRLLSPLFCFDRHEGWYNIRNTTGSREKLFGDETKDDVEAAGNNIFDNASHDAGKTEGQQSADDEDSEIRQVRNSLKDWQEISEKIETDLDTFSKEYGDQAQELVQSLKKLHREKYNYTEFLKRFMRIGEKMRLNDADFDPIFYTYGLKLYGNLPLIEPLEFKEMNNIRELVIAIDTSGSVQGDMVQGFLQKTFNILSQSENFFAFFNIHILQCDMKIRDVTVIRTREDFSRCLEKMEIRGLGGTDFRPVFSYVEEQLEKGNLRDPGGILYFTDGDGVYPKKKPVCPAAFLFPEGNKDITVPPWAVKYILEDDYAYQTGERTD